MIRKRFGRRITQNGPKVKKKPKFITLMLRIQNKGFENPLSTVQCFGVNWIFYWEALYLLSGNNLMRTSKYFPEENDA